MIQISKIEDWIKIIPKSEIDIPYFISKNIFVTPRQAIENNMEVDLCDNVDSLLKEQLKARLEQMPEKVKECFSECWDGRIVTIDEIYNEIFNDTDIGIKKLGYYRMIYTDLISKMGG